MPAPNARPERAADSVLSAMTETAAHAGVAADAHLRAHAAALDGAPIAPRPRKLRVLRWLPRAWVLTTGDASRPVLHLTFDDGPDPEHTPRMLDLLARHDARATFFLLGQNVERHPELTARIVAAGHTLGNHSWDHPRVERLTLAELREQIDRTDAMLSRFDGLPQHDFRPPRGAMPAGMVLDCIRRGIRIAYWSYDTLDYCHRAPAELAAVARMDPLRAGDVLLMHDDSVHSHGLLDVMLPEWKAQGFALEPLPGRAILSGGGR